MHTTKAQRPLAYSFVIADMAKQKFTAPKL